MSIIELKNDQEIHRYLDALDERGQKVIAVDVEAEFNLQHGQVDRIVHRRDMPDVLARLIDFFRPRRIYGK